MAVLLNLTEDHLDRYGTFDDYRRAKERIFEAQSETDFAVLNRDDPQVWSLSERVRARVVSFGFSEVAAGVFNQGENIIWRGAGAEEIYPLARVKIGGVHNVENMMAAIAAAKLAGSAAAPIQQGSGNFSRSRAPA